MNNTHKFAELDKLAEGLRGLGPDLEAGTLENTPQHKKWKSALNALPKKDQQEYKQQKYEESQKDKEWQKEQKLEKLYEKEIRPNTQIIFFWLGEKIVKEKKLLYEKEQQEENLLARGPLKEEIAQNIGIPETIDIDYSEVKDLPIAKNGNILKPYKDGFLIVRDDNPKSYQHFELSSYTDNLDTEGRMFFHVLMFKGGVHYYLNANDVEKVKAHANNLNFYFVFKRAYKNKAFKITFKNNKHITRIFDVFNKTPGKEKKVKDIVSNLPSDLITNYAEGLGVIEAYETRLDAEKEGSEALRQSKNKISNFSKKKILKTGYHISILSKFVAMTTMIGAVLQANKGEDFKNTVLNGFENLDPHDFKLLTKTILKAINEGDITAKGMISFVEKCVCDERFVKKEGKINIMELTQNLINLIISYQHTEKGTSLPLTGEINVEDATEIDCFHYWNYINLFNLVNGCLDKKDFPLLLEEGKIFNENELYKHVHELKETIAKSPFRNPHESFNLDPETKTQISEILTEAIEQTTGLLIPYNACVELKDDPIFKYIRFIEYEKYIAIFAHDQNDRFISEMYVKGEKEFRYWLYNSGQVFDSKVTESSQLLYLKLATCIRDWKVLIERDSTMKYRGPRVPTGVKSSRPRQIWLPRTSYKRSTNQEQKSREKVFFNESRKFSGERRAHRRKLQSGMKASKLQLLLAEDANIYVGDGYTFVRKTEWGKIKKSKRELKYRSKSLNGLFYRSDHEVKKAKEIRDLSPAGFEEKMEDYVAKDDWKVRSKKNYEDPGSGDGGIDIKAIKEFKDGSIKELIGQCKHPMISKKPIGPSVLRELVGAAADVKSEHEKVLMCMTSTWFTRHAMEYAERHNITLVTGGDLLK